MTIKYYGRYPDARGRFGKFGGRFAPEVLVPALEELTEAFNKHAASPEFQEELASLLRHYAGRPTPLYHAEKLGASWGCRVYLKREDLLYGGAHKLNNTLGQGLLAKYMGKPKLVAETGAGQHGFATAIAGAHFGMETKVFMGEEDVRRQAYNVYRMRLLGAEVVPVTTGSRTLKDAVNEGLRYWIANVEDTHYLMGSVVGPHPFPLIVREFQKVIGQEIRRQFEELEGEGAVPKAIVACVGGGSNAMGAFFEFVEDETVELHGVEAAGEGKETGRHSLALGLGRPGVLHGSLSHVLQDEHGNVLGTHSISAGLDYPGVGPELAHLHALGRLKLGDATDQQALDAFLELCRTEGIIPALESAHALAYARRLARELDPDDAVVVNLSGGGGKDLDIVREKVRLT
ncbi:MAG: tryptophan synthase subunit beta [Promethearchaeota archaeon]